MKIEKRNLKGQTEQIEVLDSVFGTKVNNKVISTVIYKINANLKGRKAKTKQRNEITGSTSKIYAHKGTGNARHASRKAPIFVGGGVAHGPKGENKYKVRKLNKSEKKNSVRSLISEKNNLKNLIILDDFKEKIVKTKIMYKILNDLGASNSLIITDKSSKDNIMKSTRNIPNIKLTDVGHFSSYDLIKFKKLILTVSSVKELERKYS